MPVENKAPSQSYRPVEALSEPASVLPAVVTGPAGAAVGDSQTSEPAARKPSPSPQSIGTTTNLQQAAQALIAGFVSVAGRATPGGPARNKITIDDLKQVAKISDPSFPSGLRDAAVFFLTSPIDRQLANGTGHADAMTKSGLEGVIKTESDGQLQQALLKLTEYGGTSTASENLSYATLLRDPGVPTETRNAIVGAISDARLTDIVGHPNTLGAAKDVADETNAFLGLAKTSWLGAAEAETLARYKISFSMDRGAQDKGYSSWDGLSDTMHISEKMVNAGKPGYISEVLAHEGGHAIFQVSGLEAKMAKDIAAAKLTPHIEGIINEAFAGAFGNRAHIAMFGFGDPNIVRHSVMATDLGDSLANDNTFYAKYYHVDTAAARAEIGSIHQVMANDLLPYLQNDLGLLGDPKLALGLPSPQ